MVLLDLRNKHRVLRWNMGIKLSLKIVVMVERWLGEHAENGKTVLEMVADVEEAGWPGSVPKGIVEE